MSKTIIITEHTGRPVITELVAPKTKNSVLSKQSSFTDPPDTESKVQRAHTNSDPVNSTIRSGPL